MDPSDDNVTRILDVPLTVVRTRKFSFGYCLALLHSYTLVLGRTLLCCSRTSWYGFSRVGDRAIVWPLALLFG